MNSESLNPITRSEPAGSVAPEPPPPPKTGPKKRLDWRLILLVLVALSAIPIWLALKGHAQARATAVPAAASATLPVVPVARADREDLWNETYAYAEFRAYEEVELHAKVSGYVSDMKVDFGDRVKAGQLMATLEVPELHDDLDRAQAAEQKAEADYEDAHQLYTRLSAVNKEHPNFVAQQELDTAEAKDLATQASIAGAKADVERYQTLLTYTRITAPFDGVVTHRYVDPGTLIQAGTASDTQSLPLVRVSDNYRLRLDFPVDVDYVKDIHVGETVEVRVGPLGNETFTGTITRATLRINEATRKMTAEVEVPNLDLKLVPGMYAKVLFKFQHQAQALAIPIEAVPTGYTNSLYVINNQGVIEDRQVTLGVETASRCQVTSGLKDGELVLVGSRAQVQPGEKVEPKVVGALAEE